MALASTVHWFDYKLFSLESSGREMKTESSRGAGVTLNSSYGINTVLFQELGLNPSLMNCKY